MAERTAFETSSREHELHLIKATLAFATLSTIPVISLDGPEAGLSADAMVFNSINLSGRLRYSVLVGKANLTGCWSSESTHRYLGGFSEDDSDLPVHQGAVRPELSRAALITTPHGLDEAYPILGRGSATNYKRNSYCLFPCNTLRISITSSATTQKTR